MCSTVQFYSKRWTEPSTCIVLWMYIISINYDIACGRNWAFKMYSCIHSLLLAQTSFNHSWYNRRNYAFHFISSNGNLPSTGWFHAPGMKITKSHAFYAKLRRYLSNLNLISNRTENVDNFEKQSYPTGGIGQVNCAWRPICRDQLKMKNKIQQMN